MKTTAGLIVLLLAAIPIACGPRPLRPVAATSPSSAVASSPTPSPALAASPPPPAPSSFSSPTFGPTLCRLPLEWGDAGAVVDVPTSGTGDYPASVVIDPASILTYPDGELPAEVSYDWSLHRWLPVRRQAVSPDSAHYAYVDSQGQLHLVATSDNSDRIMSPPASWSVYGLENDAVYAGQRDPGYPYGHGLWRISMSDGSTQQLATGDTWSAISNGFGWAAGYGTTEVVSSARVGGPGVRPDNPVGNRLLRIDLSTGEVTTWLTRAVAFAVVGVDPSGRPVLLMPDAFPTYTIIVVNGQEQAAQFDEGFVGDVMADSHGIWLWIPYGPTVTLSRTVDRGQQILGLPAGFGYHFAGSCQ